MSLSKEQLDEEEESLRACIRRLADTQRKQYYKLELKSVKDPDNYAALNWCFIAGLHHFYLGNYKRGTFNLLLLLFTVILLTFVGTPWPGLATLVFLSLLEIPQLFNAQNIVQAYNNQVMKKCLEEVKT